VNYERRFKSAKKLSNKKIKLTLELTVEDMEKLKLMKENAENKVESLKQQIKYFQDELTNTELELQDLTLSIETLEQG
jgi:chromosome segregation ATPase